MITFEMIADAFDRQAARVAANRAMSADELRAAYPAFFAKTEAMCRDAIGCDYRVRTDRKTVVGGVIRECNVARIDNDGWKLRAVFHVVMECGAAKTRREFDVTKLPF